MNPILQALEEGYDENQILNFISKAYPHLTKKISSAVNSGYSPKNILDFISSAMPSRQPTKGGSQRAVYAEKRRQDIEANKKLMKNAAQIALTAGGTAAIGKVMQGLPNVGRHIGNVLKGKIPASTPNQSVTVPIAEITQGGAATQEPISLRDQFENVRNVLSKTNIGKEIEKNFKSKNIENIRKMILQKATPEEKQLIEEHTQDTFENSALGYAIQLKRENEKTSKQNANKPFSESAQELFGQPTGKPGELPRELSAEEGMPMPETERPQKPFILPSGEMGNLVEERQGIGSVELPNGEIRRKKMADMVEGPEDAAVTALELIKSFTPEQERSAHHAMSFYDPDEKEAYFMFHNGNAYKVNDITPEEYERLSTEVDMAKTAGGSPYGVWATGEGSRGAAYNAIIKKLNKPYKKLQVGYNILKEWQRLIHEHEKKQKRKRPL